MFINQFNMQIKADWIAFSITKEELASCITTAIFMIARSEQYEMSKDIPIEVFVDVEDKEVISVHLHHNDEGLLNLLASKNLYNKSKNFTAKQFIKLLFGESAEFSHADINDNLIIHMNFDEYIRLSLGMDK